MLGGGLEGEGDGLLGRRGEDLDQVADGDLVGGQVEDAKPLLRAPAHRESTHPLARRREIAAARRWQRGFSKTE